MKSILKTTFLTLLAASGSFFEAVEARSVSRAAAWPYAPFVTSGRDILDTQRRKVVHAGANWSGHGEVMVPEGLQYQSVETIVTKMKSIGINSIRLTYAIEMIDQIYENNGVDIPLSQAFVEGLGTRNGTTVLAQVLAKNPSFTKSTTRLQVFDAIAAECAKQEIYVLLDNHISSGEWCCNANDGNAWFNDKLFNVNNWTRGLAFMAKHAKAWPALVAMSLRNELRSPDNNAALKEASYNWRDWYKYTKQGTKAIRSANTDVLIFLSGLNYDTTLAPVVRGTALEPGSERFDLADFDGYADKLVLELHNYSNDASDCAGLQRSLSSNGWEAMEPNSAAVNRFPVVMTEWGFNMEGDDYKRVYATCIADYMKRLQAGWFIWVLSGSYYVRQGIQDYDETWALLNHDWSEWRSPAFIESGFTPLIEGTAGAALASE